VLVGIAPMESPNTSWEFNLDAAVQMLEEAGWTMQGDVRAKDGIELRFTYVTSINEVRQKTQQVLKQSFEEAGFRVQLGQVEAGIFFDSSPGNEQNIGHMYTDCVMYTNNASSPFPIAYMNDWYAGPDRENIAQASNQWRGGNRQRYYNPDYDAVYEAVQLETDLEAAAQMFIELNDILVNDNIMVPLVNRAASVAAVSTTLELENLALGSFMNDYWNIANWIRVEG
jgi:peptide/nickel transport system substrate-binding protein